jgi:16S rRNA (guanine(527)-N(7))-methyltransferase RsmG
VKPQESGHQLLAAEVTKIVRAAPELAGSSLNPAFFDRIERFAALLTLWGEKINLTAHPDDPVEIAFHVVDSLAPAFTGPRFFSPPGDEKRTATVLDLGSGAGFPGLILASAVDADFTLIESRRKRTSFLSTAATEMKLTNVAIRSQRASAASVGGTFDVVTSRAVGEVALEVIAGALRPEGFAILWVNPEQPINMAGVRDAGLAQVVRHGYSVHRGDQLVRRTLLVLGRN